MEGPDRGWLDRLGPWLPLIAAFGPVAQVVLELVELVIRVA